MPPKLLRNAEVSGHQRWMPLPSPEPLPDPATLYADARREALAQAAMLMETARGEAETIRRQAEEAGFLAGQTAAEVEYQRRMGELLAQVEEINAERAAFFTRAESELARLATVIAEKVIAQHLVLHPETIIDITRACLKRIRDREDIYIRAHPEDLPILQDARAALMLEVDGISEFHLVEDRRIHRGGVIVETGNGTLDARISSQLAVVTKALESAVEESSEPASE
jgi:flagellar biosynthesis/type III secretory pathway protein FliH